MTCFIVLLIISLPSPASASATPNFGCGDGYVNQALGEECDELIPVNCRILHLPENVCCNPILHPENQNDPYCILLDNPNNPQLSCNGSICKRPRWCGDGIQQPWEDCDDGNTNDGDSCPFNCDYTAGGSVQ